MVCKHKGLFVVHEFSYGEAGKNKTGPFIQSVSAGTYKNSSEHRYEKYGLQT